MKIKELAKKYNPKEHEKRIADGWVKNKTFSFEKDNIEKTIYSIDSPPPTVSGKLHIGHAYGAAIMDFVARYKRLKGYNVFLPMGTDDNGLPTQRLVEKLKNIKSREMSRKDFIKLCTKVITEPNGVRDKYLEDFKNWGISVDWDISYSTIDKHSRKISQKHFIDLYNMGRAYRQDAATMWCPTCQTAIAQVELEDCEKDSVFNDIIFKVKNQDLEENLVISTTRPELLPACVAVFYNPTDVRYKKYLGKKAKVPLFNFEVPILEDERADPDKGTGIVMCCTFGDQTDIEWQKLHNLPIRNALTHDGKLSSLAEEYEGLDIKEGRKRIIEDLKKNNLLTNQIKIKHVVNVHERCGTPVEFIQSKQWFIKYLDLKDDMLLWGKEFNWVPEFYVSRYNNWVNGLGWDWCVSRQIYFGVPFPIWYCESCGEPIFAKEQDLPVDPTEDKPPLDRCPNCESEKIVPEKDVINTWATSSLTPTIAKELVKNHNTYDLLKDVSMDLRIEGNDIISFWLFNTVFRSKMHNNIIPWKNAINTGWVLDDKGKKMAKSKGNIIEPQEIVNKYSADIFRYFSATYKLGHDIPFNEKELINGKKTITKLYNATKFAYSHLEDYKFDINDLSCLSGFDLHMLNKLNKVIEDVNKNNNNFDFSKTLSNLELFFWKDVCDNYLEIVKDRLYNPDKRGKQERKNAQATLFVLFKDILKMYSVIMPFVTEYLYDAYFIDNEQQETIHKTKFPEKYDVRLSDSIINEIIEILSFIRNYKSSKNLSLKTEITKLEIETQEDIKEVVEDLKASMQIQEIAFVSDIKNEDYKTKSFKIKINL